MSADGIGNSLTLAFLAHGRAELQSLQLKNWLASIGVRAILVEEEDDLGLSIIDKFEHYARKCDVAFVFLTPDDRLLDQGHDLPKEVYIARQNALVELGWFLRHLGRQAVIILHQEGTTLPSDIEGILRLSFQRSVLETTERIRRRLVGLELL
ncbi:TIR domain-containing protein [Actinoplanes sp. NBRC 103695]|uniref:TIR domain-containing protein n=1 Tax=Actinoplanes sp. NBRC 103695 TaxID=3032202 RepID=UPI0024A394FD|nr:TIR domain-containing protein [Actinoplanes sp. NBRC 103695]GLY95360.1 hypothetical protein Acsp02_26150 [Actinoplanes sp. NBRC 103695]